MKRYLVMFSRLGPHRAIPHYVEAREMAAAEAPIKEWVEEVLERENIIVTIVDGKGQLNYGLLGEFTIQPG